MSVDSTHPQYDKMQSVWELANDSYGGELAVKERGTRYLPATSGQVEDGMGKTADSVGQLAYEAYKMRSVYPDLYRETVESNIGTMHRKPPLVTALPPSMKSMIERATAIGESLEALMRRVNVQQLTTGRLGVMGDISINSDVVTPKVSVYNELAILNWDDRSDDGDSVDLRLVVLDESSYEMNGQYAWEWKKRYRVLAMCSEDDSGDLTPDPEGGIYAVAEIEDDAPIAGATFIAPEHMGKRLDRIPFSFINSKDISPVPDMPPLLGLALLCMAIYRGEADYRQSLFLQGQDTLVRIGVDPESNTKVRTGAGASIDIPLSTGDAKYIGVDSSGLSEQRSALENDYSRASQKGGQLLDATSNTKESGEALRIRVAAQTTTLPMVAETGAAGVQKVIRDIAPWFGSTPEAIDIQPNLDFTNDVLDGQTLVEMQTAKTLGAKLSHKSIHAWAAENGATKLSFEEELEEIAKEDPVLG